MTVVALAAAVVGTWAGVPVAGRLADVFAGFDDLPDHFEYRRSMLPLGVSLAVTWGAASLAALAAARAAGRASPAAAMTGASTGQQRLGVLRWLLGLLFLAGAVALLIVSATANDDAGLAVGYVFMVTATALTAVAMLGPVVVRPTAQLVGVPFRLTTIGSLAVTNAAAEARRTTATASPVALMVAVNVAMVQASLAASDLDVEGTQLWSLWLMTAISVGFAAIAIVNTTAMTVARRRNQLAALRLAGAAPRQARRSSEIEAVVGALAGSLIGVAIATAACWAFAAAVDVALGDLIEWPLIAGLAAVAAAVALATAAVTAGSILADDTLVVEDE